MVGKMIAGAAMAAAAWAAGPVQAAPVALHYTVSGGANIYNAGPPGALGLSFDLYYDPALLGSVTANGGLATNGYYFYSPYAGNPLSDPGYAAAGSFTSVSAVISALDPQRVAYDPRLRGLSQLTVSASSPNASGFTELYIDSVGRLVSNNYLYGISVKANGVSHYSEYQVLGVSAVPEPVTWAMMITGIGFVGGALRSARRRRATPLAV